VVAEAAELQYAMGGNAVGHDAGNAHHRAKSCGAAGRDDLHVLQISKLQAQLTHDATVVSSHRYRSFAAG
jgi:hypothetical protein